MLRNLRLKLNKKCKSLKSIIINRMKSWQRSQKRRILNNHCMFSLKKNLLKTWQKKRELNGTKNKLTERKSQLYQLTSQIKSKNKNNLKLSNRFFKKLNLMTTKSSIFTTRTLKDSPHYQAKRWIRSYSSKTENLKKTWSTESRTF